MHIPKQALSIFIVLTQIISPLFSADLRVRHHIAPLDGDVKAPQMINSANGRDVVNIVNPNTDGISHNKYQSFDIGKDNGVILNNSLENGTSLIGGYVVANPNLTSNAKLIINEVISTTDTSLNGVLEVFGKNADIIIANQNGLVVNGAIFINTNGVTLTTGLIDNINRQISVNKGNIDILEKGVGADGDYFNIIAKSMEISGNISKIDGNGLGSVNFIAGLNDVSLDVSMDNPHINQIRQSESSKPSLSIDGNILGSMYAGYIRFISTQEGVGVRHDGVIRSANDIIIDAKGDISSSALLATNINIKTTANINNEGLMLASEVLKTEAKDFHNTKIFNKSVKEKINLNVSSPYVQAKQFETKAKKFHNKGSIISNNFKSQSVDFKNDGVINVGNFEADSNDFSNTSQINALNAAFLVSSLSNSGKIESEEQTLLSFKDDSKPLANVLDNHNGTISSKGILKLKSGLVVVDSTFRNLNAGEKFLIESSGDIDIKEDFISVASIGLKAAGNIKNQKNTLLASQKDIYLEGKTFFNEQGGYIFGNDIAIKADNITNKEDAMIDARNILFLSAKRIDNNVGFIHSFGDMNIFTQTLYNNSKAIGAIEFQTNPGGSLYYYYAKNYFGNRDFNANYTSYSIKNNLENKQAIIQSGGRLNIQFEEDKKANVYNNGSVIAATKDIIISGNVHNHTKEINYNVEDLLRRFSIQDITAIPTFAGNLSIYKIGSGNVLEILDKAKYSEDDNVGYFGLLKVLSSKDSFFKALMAKGFGSDWVIKEDPNDLSFNPNTTISYLPKNTAKILSGGQIILLGGGILQNSTGSTSKEQAQADISLIPQAGLKEKPIIQNPDNLNEGDGVDFQGLDETTILAFGKQLLFHSDANHLNKKINFYIETRKDLVDMSQFFGSEYFFSQINYVPEKPISVIGDAYFENRLLNEQLIRNLGYSQSLNNNDIKELFDNAVSESVKLGLVIGKALSEEQIKELDKDIIWYVERKIGDKEVLTPQIFYSKNTTFKRLPDSNEKNSMIASVGNVFLEVGDVENQSSVIKSLQGNTIIKAQGEVKNIGGVISGDEVGIIAERFSSESVIGMDKTGNAININQAALDSNNGLFIQTQKDIVIKNTSIQSSDEGAHIDLISENGEIKIIEDNAKNSDFMQESKKDSDSFWVSTTMVEVDSVQSSKLQADNITIKSKEGITIQGSALSQTSSKGNLNLISDGDIKILEGREKVNLVNDTRFDGMNKNTNMFEYLSLSHTDTKIDKAVGSSIQALGNINIVSKKDLSIQASDLYSKQKIILVADGNIDIIDSHNQTTLNSSQISSQLLGFKGSDKHQDSSLSTGSSVKSDGEMIISSEGNTSVIGSDVISTGGRIVFNSKKDLTYKPGKNSMHYENISYGFGIVGSAGAGLLGNSVSAGFGNNEEQNFTNTHNAFDPQSLTSGKTVMDALASADVGLEFGLDYQKADPITYTNSNIVANDDLLMFAKGTADIGGANFISSNNGGYLEAGNVQSTKYKNEENNFSIGLHLSLKQKLSTTSSMADSMNMISGVSAQVAAGQNINAGIVAAQAAGAATNLIFNDIIGVNSTQEVSLNLGFNASYGGIENITHIDSSKDFIIKTTKGDIDLNGVAFNGGSSLYLDSARDVNIQAAKNTKKEIGLDINVSGTFQESAGYSALWGANTDIGTGGSASISYSQKDQNTFQSSMFDVKDHLVIVAKEDVNINGGRFNADTADVYVGGNLNITSPIDSKDSKDFNISLGGDVSLGVASNTIAKGDFSLNAGAGYYYDNSKSVGVQSGILTKGELNVKVLGDAQLNGGILSSSIEEGDFDVGGKLQINDLDLEINSGGGAVYVSGGTSGDFGTQIDIGDFNTQKSILHTAININTAAKGGIEVNGKSIEAKDIFSDVNNALEITSSNSFAGGNMSFSGSVGQIKQLLSSKPKPNHLISSQDNTTQGNVIFSGIAEPLHFEPVVLKKEVLLYGKPNRTDNEGSNPSVTRPSTSMTSVSLEQTPFIKKIKNFFRLDKSTYDVGNAQNLSNQASMDSYKKINENLPPKSEFAQTEQALIASQNKHQKDLDKFANIGEEVIPERIPIKTEDKRSESDKQDLIDFMERGVFEVQDVNLSQTAGILNTLMENPIFSKQNRDRDVRENFIILLSEIGENLPYHNDSGEYKNFLRGVYQDLDSRLINNPAIKDYLLNSDFSKQKHFREFTQMIVDAYTETLNNTPLNSTDTKINFSPNYDYARYSHQRDAIEILTPKEYKELYLKNQKNVTSKQVGLTLLDTVVHEMTHKQQAVFIKNLDNPNIPQSIKDYTTVLKANKEFYFRDGDQNYHMYRDQIFEKEAFEHGGAVKRKFENILAQDPQLDNPIEATQSSGSNSNSILDRIRRAFSRENLNEPDAEVQNHFYNQKEKNIEHFPVNQKNFESSLEGEPNFSNIALIYGLHQTRGDLYHSLSPEEVAKRPLVADDYLNALNMAQSPDRQKRFYEFASSVASGNPNLLKEEILNFKPPITKARENGVASIPKGDNQKIFEGIVGDENNLKIIKNIDSGKNLMDAIKKVAQEHNMDGLSNLINRSTPNVENLTREEKKLYDIYFKNASALNEERFFGIKTTEVLKNVLDSGGKIYFNLDLLVTEHHSHTDKVKDLDLKKLKNVFDPSNEHYESVTSEELRYIFKNYREHPNLKFTIKKQFIENPFKSTEVIEAIQSQINKVKN
ncbi:hemagglutinin repeat-containing protein [Helicobacter sp. 13S00477-4]|uniref:two-partner secretion domain-containing protein n=1 Tax=Helicobacter sp. 13S00477-4 TaxID=1905759 RepID=UPI000BA59618|nr:hemagglutinin repeat-containing protein [Helicobacter sp. 13S00477-4]PAF51020.1 hypothetical protein BKH44_06390 [Helicobacter sp. 13S00477-4]